MRKWFAAAGASLALMMLAPAAHALDVVTFDEGTGFVVDLDDIFGDGTQDWPVWADEAGGYAVGRYDPFLETLVAPDVSNETFVLSTNEILFILHGSFFEGFPIDVKLGALDLDADGIVINGFALNTCGCLEGPSLLFPDETSGFQTMLVDPALTGFLFAFGTEEAMAALFGDGDPLIDSAGSIASAAPGQWAVNNISLTAVPEPGTWTLMIGGLGAIGYALRRRSIALAA